MTIAKLFFVTPKRKKNAWCSNFINVTEDGRPIMDSIRLPRHISSILDNLRKKWFIWLLLKQENEYKKCKGKLGDRLIIAERKHHANEQYSRTETQTISGRRKRVFKIKL